MAITGNLLRLITRYEWLGQKCENVAWYTPGGAAFLTATMAGVAEAYWNNIKDRYRAIVPTEAGAVFTSILGTEFNGSEGYGEFAIPAGERAGTRVSGEGELVTGTLAVGVRLTVATRLTRPGQKRVPFLKEGDIYQNELDAGIIALMETLSEIWSTDLVLGAPVALGTLSPVVVTFNSAPLVVEDTPQEWQAVVGALVNHDITSQVSRKKGRGS